MHYGEACQPLKLCFLDCGGCHHHSYDFDEHTAKWKLHVWKGRWVIAPRLIPEQVWLGSVWHLESYRNGQGQLNMPKDKASAHHPLLLVLSPLLMVLHDLLSDFWHLSRNPWPALLCSAQDQTPCLMSQNEYISGGLAAHLWSLIVELKCVLCGKQFQAPKDRM